MALTVAAVIALAVAAGLLALYLLFIAIVALFELGDEHPKTALAILWAVLTSIGIGIYLCL
jgi:hypothetical protein